MSQFRCHACDVPITLLTSQKNGNMDTCLSCAIEAAPLLRYVLKRRSDVLHDDVVCQQHYREDSQAGGYMAPLADREIGAGYVQTVTPYAGDRPCATCAELAERLSNAGDTQSQRRLEA